jgi:hypothetical protein
MTQHTPARTRTLSMAVTIAMTLALVLANVHGAFPRATGVVRAASAAAPAAGDTVQGTFTVKGKTILFTHVYVTRSANPAEPGSMYLAVLVTDAPVPASARKPAQLVELAKAGTVHAVRVVWKEGFDGLTATAFHSAIEESGQPTSGGAMIDLRGYNDRHLDAKITSRPLGQEWHFSATVAADVAAVTSTADEFVAPVPIVAPTGVDVELDTRVEADERTNPTALKQRLGRLGYEFTGEGFVHAVNDGDLDAVNLFLRLGMDANTKADDQAILINATTFCTHDPIGPRAAIVKALLAAHATVDAKDENGSTPLLWSVNVGCPAEIVRVLIAAGANVNVKAKGGGTPLMLANVLGRPELVTMLKQAGARQ